MPSLCRAVLLLAAAAAAPLARAQLAPSCPASVAFLNNSMGQDPCHVASSLLGQCTGTEYNLTVLGTTFAGYGGPVSTDPSQYTLNGCLCCDPIYNLFMACQAACQAKNVITFAAFTASCNSSFTGSTATPTLAFSQTVPNDTAIPPWAEINNMGGSWSLAQAQANVSGSAAPSSSAPASSGSTGASAPPTSVPTQGSSGGSSSNAGPIAGGVVGGLAVLTAIGTAAWYLLRRTKRKEKKSKTSTHSSVETGHGARGGSGGMQQVQHPYPSPHGSTFAAASSQHQHPLPSPHGSAFRHQPHGSHASGSFAYGPPPGSASASVSQFAVGAPPGSAGSSHGYGGRPEASPPFATPAGQAGSPGHASTSFAHQQRGSPPNANPFGGGHATPSPSLEGTFTGKPEVQDDRGGGAGRMMSVQDRYK